jgi:hypothetical protein
MRRALDKAITAGAALVIVASVILSWSWRESRRAKQQPPQQHAAAA